MTRLRYGLVLVLAAALQGCGGQSSSSLDPAPAAPPPAACTSVSGEAAVGGVAVGDPEGCSGLGGEQDLQVADPGLAGERLGAGSTGALCATSGGGAVAPVGDGADLEVSVGSEKSDC